MNPSILHYIRDHSRAYERKKWTENVITAFLVGFFGVFLTMLSIFNTVILAVSRASAWYTVLSILVMFLLIASTAMIATYMEQRHMHEKALDLGAFLGLLSGSLFFIIPW